MTAGSEPEPEQIVILDTATGEPINDDLSKGPVESLTVEQAAQLLTTYHDNKAAFDAKSISNDFAAEVDKMRADALKANPKLAEHYGIERPAVDDADAKPVADNARNDKAAEMSDGELDPELAESIRKHPQVRQMLENELSENHRVREAYSAGLENSRVHTLATLAEVVPHLAGLPPAQFEQGLAVLSQVDPPAFQQAMNILGRTHAIVQAQQQEQQYQAYQAHQQFEAQRQQFSKQADEAIGPMTRADKMQMVDELTDYVGRYGVSRDQFIREAQGNLALHHPAFQAMAADAIRYQRMKSAAKVQASKPLPPVQKPGTSRSSGSYQSDNIAALDAKLSRSGSIKDATALYMAQSKARG